MARAFNGSSDKGVYSGAPVTAVPFTLAAWAFRPSGANTGVVLGVYKSGDYQNTNLFQISMSSTAGSDVTLSAQAANSSAGLSSSPCVRTSGQWANSSWGSIVGVFTSATDRLCYGQGVAGTTDTTSKVPSGIDTTAIGVRQNLVPTSFFGGSIAEAAIWNVALTAEEASYLALGISPLLVRPDALLAYWPLWGIYSPEIELMNGYAFTLTGTSVVDQPATIQSPGGQRIFLPQATVATNPFPAWMGMRQVFEEEFEYLAY